MKLDERNVAPIVLFVYNRPYHTARTLEALRANDLSAESELFVYSDGPVSGDSGDSTLVAHVRREVAAVNGFRSVHVVERERNIGLAANIIDGVSDVINARGRVIVVEDDLVTSPLFLRFMNLALDQYVNEKKIMHISGWNYPIDPEGLPEVFLWRVMNCWGWGTWADRWQHYEKKPGILLDSWSPEEIASFNLDGCNDFWSQVVDNSSGRIDTWAIFWYASVFSRRGLCLNPTVTFVDNIGHDGTGANCGRSDAYRPSVRPRQVPTLDVSLEECSVAVDRIKAFYRTQNSMLSRVGRRLARLLK